MRAGLVLARRGMLEVGLGEGKNYYRIGNRINAARVEVGERLAGFAALYPPYGSWLLSCSAVPINTFAVLAIMRPIGSRYCVRIQ